MFRSLRWRLVTSYVLLTLLTVIVLGVLVYAFVRQYAEGQETVFLRSNAEAVARQAQPLVWPTTRISDLNDLVKAASFLGNVRIRIFDDNYRMLVDSGPPTEVDQFLWIMPPVEDMHHEAQSEAFKTFILPLPYNGDRERIHISGRDYPLLGNLPSETRFSYLQRISQPWGNLVVFEGQPEYLRGMTVPRSNRVFQIPIGDGDSPLGFVELRNGPDFGVETLETLAQSFLLAAVGAVLLAGVVGLIVSKRLTTHLVRLTAAASQMEGGDLSIRAPHYGGDEIGQLARQFNRMAERLEASFTEIAAERDTLRRFIADASHELRTPITALKNFNELLQGKAKGDLKAREEFLSESEAQLDRLEWITNNLLNISRLDAGLTPLNIDDHDMGGLLEAALVPFKVQADEKGITLIVNVPEPSFEFVADRAMMELALSNLIDNALKFTSRGGHVKIGASMAGDTIRLWVRDNGAGIDPTDLPHIFESFYQGRKVGAEGSGLGLAMVDRVVKAHGGQIKVESEPGAGSHFVIEMRRDGEAATENVSQGEAAKNDT